MTICAERRECLFGDVVNGEMQDSMFGTVVREEWLKSPKIRAEIELDEFVVMPNHLHGIVVILPVDSGGNRSDVFAEKEVTARVHDRRGPLPKSLGSFVAGFKSVVTKRINEMRGTPGAVVWQRNYYEHIIRSEESLDHLRAYVATNPLKWELDQLHPSNPSKW